MTIVVQYVRINIITAPWEAPFNFIKHTRQTSRSTSTFIIVTQFVIRANEFTHMPTEYEFAIIQIRSEANRYY